MSLIVELVHRRDALIAERDERVAELDREIESIEAKLEMMARGSRRRGPLQLESDPVPDEDDEGGEGAADVNKVKTDRLLWWISTGKVLDYGRIATELHGDDTPKTRKRVRSSLAYLARQGRIRNLGSNTWEVLG